MYKNFMSYLQIELIILKVVILAGGLGTRLIEETRDKPKPMVLIGNKPMLWHIMKIYSTYGINDFIICLGYKGDVIKQFFDNTKSKKEQIKRIAIPDKWKITLVDTGLNTMTGGRLRKVKKYLKNDTFCFTYGDTLNNVNIDNLIDFHRKKNAVATVTACIPPEKYGILKIKKDKVIDFKEKPNSKKDWVNGGFFVLEPEIFDLIENNTTSWEQEPMEKLSKSGRFYAYRHSGFYQPMDTLREKNYLNKLWRSGKAPWKIW